LRERRAERGGERRTEAEEFILEETVVLATAPVMITRVDRRRVMAKGSVVTNQIDEILPLDDTSSPERSSEVMILLLSGVKVGEVGEDGEEVIVILVTPTVILLFELREAAKIE
jgi:hypothetical protein